MKFLVLCMLLGAPLAFAGKGQSETSQPYYERVDIPAYQQEPQCRTVCRRQAPNDDDTIRIQARRYRRNINANIIEIREAPAKAIAIGLPPPLLNFDEERILREESNEEIPATGRNETDYVGSATMSEP